MSNASRSMQRRQKHAVTKVYHKIKNKFALLKSKLSTTDAEAWDQVVRELSHKDLKILVFDADNKQFKSLSDYNHLMNLAQSALFEKAMNR